MELSGKSQTSAIVGKISMVLHWFVKVFDDIFSAEEVSIFKPDSKVYDIPVKKYKIEKHEVAFLSANTWDVSGGGNYGYNAIWVNRNNIIFDNLDYFPENQINNLKDLLDII